MTGFMVGLVCGLLMGLLVPVVFVAAWMARPSRGRHVTERVTL